MKLNILKTDGSSSSVEVSLDLGIRSHAADYAYAVVSRVAKQNKKQGTKKVKTRSEVKGRAKKPYKQKTTGNARQGSRKGPHMRGGGIAHGPKMDTTTLSLNKKMKANTLKNLLLDLVSDNKLSLLEVDSNLNKIKKSFDSKTLIAYSKENLEYVRSLKNFENIKLVEVSTLNPAMLLDIQNFYIDSKGIEKLEGLLK